MGEVRIRWGSLTRNRREEREPATLRDCPALPVRLRSADLHVVKLQTLERQVAHLKQELRMHDALAGKAGETYAEYTPEQRMEIQHQVKEYLAAPLETEDSQGRRRCLVLVEVPSADVRPFLRSYMPDWQSGRSLLP